MVKYLIGLPNNGLLCIQSLKLFLRTINNVKKKHININRYLCYDINICNKLHEPGNITNSSNFMARLQLVCTSVYNSLFLKLSMYYFIIRKKTSMLKKQTWKSLLSAEYFRKKIYFALNFLGTISNLHSSLTINNLKVFLPFFFLMFNKSTVNKIKLQVELRS